MMDRHSIFTGLDDNLFVQAQAEARRFRHKYVRAEHLLLALLYQSDSPAAKRLQAAGISYAGFSAHVARLNCPVCGAEEKLVLAEGARRAVLGISFPNHPPGRRAPHHREAAGHERRRCNG